MKCAFAIIAIVVTAGFGQTRFPMRFLDEVGNLGNEYSDEKRQSADLGIARVSADTGKLKVQGVDDAGQRWQVRLPQVGGLGWTEVWTADFDANGRKDLLFAGHFPGVGRCISRVEITLMLFGGQGRPRLWVVSTMIPNESGFPYVPIIILDLNRDGRAEFVTTSCERIEPPEGFGERLTLSGLYEARQAQLVPMRGTGTDPYVRIARQIHGEKSIGVLPPENWPAPRRTSDQQWP